jgi:hypothetical protein
MKPIEIVTAIRAKDSALLDGLTDKRAENLIKAALSVVRESVAALETGDLQVVMLGRFRATEVTKGEGEEAHKVRRVVYLPPKPIDKAAQEAQAARAAAKATAAKPPAKAGKPKA